MNDEIRAANVRLVGPEGRQVGVVPRATALAAAQELDLDLVEVAPDADPPVAKVMDYGKHRYEQSKAERDRRREQRRTEAKVVRVRPKIDDHDLATKLRHARGFLEDGVPVVVELVYRGRELRRPELGRQVLERVEEELVDVGEVVARSGLDGRRASLRVEPRGAAATR